MLALLTVPTIVYFLIASLLIGRKVGMNKCLPVERALCYALLVAFATICTIQTDLALYLFSSMAMNMYTSLDVAKPVAMSIMGVTFVTFIVLTLTTFFYGRHFKPELRLGKFGRFAFDLE